MSAKLIPLSKGKAYAIVDSEDYEYLSQWNWKLQSGRAARNRHISILPNGKRKDETILMHRVITDAPAGMDVDHKNGSPLDNRRSNLRVCTHHQNTMNKKKQFGTASRFKGVYFDSRKLKWYAQVSFMGKGYTLALFDEEIEAAKEYDHVAKQLYGNFANLNFGGQDH